VLGSLGLTYDLITVLVSKEEQTVHYNWKPGSGNGIHQLSSWSCCHSRVI